MVAAHVPGVRPAALAAAVLTAVLVAVAVPATANEIASARYAGPTTRYPHNVLGDAIEHDTLEAVLTDGRRTAVRWGADMVFEDTAPRLVDLDGDGAPEVIVVESHADRGARLAVYGLSEAGTLAVRTATPFIGTRFRWLAPVGAADLDGDGAMEIAYVDRPHLAKELRVVRVVVDPGAPPGAGAWRLEPVAALPGVTNHRIGDAVIIGGIRRCGARPEMVLATADWSRLVAVSLISGRLGATDLGPFAGAASLRDVMEC